MEGYIYVNMDADKYGFCSTEEEAMGRLVRSMRYHVRLNDIHSEGECHPDDEPFDSTSVYGLRERQPPLTEEEIVSLTRSAKDKYMDKPLYFRFMNLLDYLHHDVSRLCVVAGKHHERAKTP